MLAGRRFQRRRTGVYACAELELDLTTWLQAAFLVLPADAVVTGLTGLHARDVLVGPPWPLQLVTTHDRPVRRPGLRVIRAGELPPHIGAVAVAGHCFAAACAGLDLVDAVTAADWLLQRGRPTRQELVAYAATFAGAGARAARRALGHARERVESPREDPMRLLLTLCGLPEPECNVDIGTGVGFLGRADLVYALHRLVVEYDGRQHAMDARQWERDVERLDGLDAAGWTHVRVTDARLRRPREVALRVFRGLVANGYAGPAPVFGTEWVALFERRSAARRAQESPDAGSWSADRALVRHPRPPR